MKIDNVLFVGKSKKKTGNTKFMLNALKRRVKKATFINVPRCKKLYFWTDYKKIIFKKIINTNPDLILIYSKDLPIEILEKIKGDYTLAMFYPDPDGPKDKKMIQHGRLVDTLFITNKTQLDQFKAAGVKNPVFCMQGCDRDEHRLIAVKSSKWASDVAFIGRPLKGGRIDLLQLIDQHYSLKVWGGKWEKYNLTCLKNHVYPKEYARICYAARIVLGCDQKNQMDSYFSNRTWITMGCRGFLLTNYVPGLENFFTKGVHLEWYKTEKECLDLIDYYLKHGGKRKKIAQNGYEFVHLKRTYDIVMDEIISHMENHEK